MTHYQLRQDIQRFIEFKRACGFKYERAHLALLSFARFVSSVAGSDRRMRLDQAMEAWVAHSTGRKALTVAFYIGVLRQFCAFLRRATRRVVREPLWPPVPGRSDFRATILTRHQIRDLVRRAGRLSRPRYRGVVFRMLILLLYCTGLRFGEAVRLRIGDINLRSNVISIAESKGRARIVPFHLSLGRDLKAYLGKRRRFAQPASGDHLFLGAAGRPLKVSTASNTVRELLQDAGLKPATGRVGPRPYDIRHTFAVHRLTRWYRAGVDLQARLPWLSAYMGHVDILGTETYLTATPELLGLAGDRFRRRYMNGVKK